jgi:WD40 repeat protein
MTRAKIGLIGLVIATVALSAALAYTYRIYTLAESNRRQQSKQLDRTIDGLERVHRLRLREHAEYRRGEAGTRKMHRTLAAAYRHGASQMLRDGRPMAAGVFTAAALLHNPDNPLSPYRGDATSAPLTAEGHAGITASQSVLYEAAVRSVIKHRRPSPKLGFRVWSTAFSPDGKLLAVGGDSRKVRLWDVVRGRWAGDLTAPAMPVFEVAFSPDGKLLAAATNAGKVRIWHMDSRKKARTLDAHGSMALSVRFSPDGRRLASGGMDRMIRIWDIPTWSQVATFRQAQGAVWALDFSPDGRMLASAAWHGTSSRVRLWSLKDNRAHANYTGHLGPVWTVAFSPDGQHLVSGGLDRSIRVFSTHKLRLLTTLKHHTADVTSLAFSSDGRWLVSASIDKTFVLWRTDRWKPITRVSAHGRQIWSVAMSRKGGLLATGAWDHRVRIWSLGGGKLRPVLLQPRPAERGRPFVAAWYTAKGDRIVGRDASNVFHVWDLASKKMVARRRLLPPDLQPAALSGDTKHIVTSGPGATLWVWPLYSKERATVLRGPTAPITGVAFAPDGTTVAASSRAGTVRLWRWTDRKEIDRIEKVSAPLAFSPDGKLLATSDSKRRIRLLQVKDLNPHRTLPSADANANVDRVVFSPSSDRLLAVQDDQTMVLWNTRTGRRIAQLSGHTDEIVNACFSGDGRYILSTSRDRTVRIWQTSTGLELQRLTLPQVAQRAAFAPDSKHFAVPTPEGVAIYPVRLHLWRQNPRQLLQKAEAAAALKLDGFHLRPAD